MTHSAAHPGEREFYVVCSFVEAPLHRELHEARRRHAAEHDEHVDSSKPLRSRWMQLGDFGRGVVFVSGGSCEELPDDIVAGHDIVAAGNVVVEVDLVDGSAGTLRALAADVPQWPESATGVQHDAVLSPGRDVHADHVADTAPEGLRLASPRSETPVTLHAVWEHGDGRYVDDDALAAEVVGDLLEAGFDDQLPEAADAAQELLESAEALRDFAEHFQLEAGQLRTDHPIGPTSDPFCRSLVGFLRLRSVSEVSAVVWPSLAGARAWPCVDQASPDAQKWL